MRRFSFGLLMSITLVLQFGCNSGGSVRETTSAWPAGTGFVTKSITVDNNTRNYAVFIPKDHGGGKKYPAIIFLHGVLEAGSDSQKNLGVGIGPHIAKSPDTWPFITIFPQVSGDWQGDFAGKVAIAALDQCQKDYAIDPDRVFVTGLSNGGQGTWIIGAKYKDRFAGLAPMCGHSAYDSCPNLTGIAIWCFHNGVDPLVPSGGAKEMCKRIKEAGGDVQYTQYGDFGHNCWDRAFKEGEVLKWMQTVRRGAKATARVP